MSYDNLNEALVVARREERRTGDYRWVTCDYEGVYRVEDHMPFLGEYYDAEGHRHAACQYWPMIARRARTTS
jgi:hypothetical protein